MSRPKWRHRRFIHKRNRRLFFESLEKREVLTTVFVITGNPQVAEPSVPGTTVNAQFSISYTTMGGPDVGGSVNWGAGAVGDSATSGTDYEASSGSVSLGPGNPSQIINVPVNYDQLTEGNEYFTVTLSGNSAGSMIMQSSATGVISDPEAPPPGVSVSSSTRVLEGDDNGGAFLGGITLAGTNVCYVFLETLRDLATNAATVPEPILKQRVTLHESGHTMGLHHTGGVMLAANNMTGTSADNFFTNAQLGRIQGQTMPSTTPEPPAP